MVQKGEVYHFFHICFNIFPLWEYAKAHLETIEVNLDEIAKGYGFNLPPNQISMFRCDKDYAMKLTDQDTEQPLLFVNMGNAGNLMIDGTHRAYKTWKSGVRTAKAYWISAKDILLKHTNLTEAELNRLLTE